MSVKNISLNVREIGREKGFDAESLAEALGTPVGTVRKWWEGCRTPTACAVFKIARAYGVEIEKLFEGVM